jgi:hypothetical protein
METCPRCGHQYLCCDCEREYEEDDFEVAGHTVFVNLRRFSLTLRTSS